MRVLPVPALAAFLSVISVPAALAHPGHLAEVAGHAHWIALGAAALAAAIAAAVAGAKERDEPEEAEA